MVDPSATIPLAIALPFLAAALTIALGRSFAFRSGWLVAAAALASSALLVDLARRGGDPPVFRSPWLPAINVELAFRADAFGLFFALLVAGMGVLVTLYSIGYLDRDDAERARRYYAALAVFMGSMLGIALADDLIVLFVFWELTSISSFLLIGYRYADEDAKSGALTALQVTALGGLVMSVGFLIIGQVCETFSLSLLVSDPERVARLLDSPLGTWALLLVLCGAATKSAQVPFHFWLPQAMVAPTPISAYLHAATMVKAGVFLLGRLLPVFGQSPLWFPALATLGTATMLVGAYRATQENDLKAILAWTTASTLGLLFLLYGIGAAEQDALQMLNHALYKGSLFLVAGIVEHHAHTRDLDRLGGLRRALPLTFVAAVLAALSMAGLPPLFGFLAKESVYEALLHSSALEARPAVRLVILAGGLLSSALLAVTAYRFAAGIFLGQAPLGSQAERAPSDEHGANLLWVAPLVLALTALALGVAGVGSVAAELSGAASSRGGAHLVLSIVPHLGAPLFASLLALALAVPLYRGRVRIGGTVARLLPLPSASDIWQRLLATIVRIGEAFSQRWENGSLRWYLAGTILTTPLLIACAFGSLDLSPRILRIDLSELPWYGLLFCALLAVSTLAAVRARTRLAAAIASSATGFLVAMLYVVYRSPDILLTQILIETVSTIFILLVLLHLPQFPRHDLSSGGRLLNAAIAAGFGLAITLMLLLATSPGIREADNIATRPGGLLSLSLAQGGGANAVNVIIVDIRALDTNGEITVLVVVGLCIYGLLRARRKAA